PTAAHRRVDADPLQQIGHVRSLSITALPPYALPRKSRITTRFPGAAQHVAKRSDALLTRDRNRRRVQSDPGSAVHRFALHRIRETQTNALRNRAWDDRQNRERFGRSTDRAKSR